MTEILKIALIRGSLPSYFPEKHGVWKRAQNMLAALCDELKIEFFITSKIPMNGQETRHALDESREQKADFILLLHGGFTMGDVARTIAASEFRAGFWSVPEPVRTGDIQLNNFVSLNMSLSIARQVRDLRTHPVQWYHGAPQSAPLVQRMKTTLLALRAVKSLACARIGVVGGLAMTFYNMETSSSQLKSRLGVEIFQHDMHEMTGRMEAMPKDRVMAEVAAMSRTVPVAGVSEEQMELTGQAVLALRDIAHENKYAALAVSDWPALQTKPGMHPGAAFTWLEEQDRLPVASEGDVLGAITQLVAKSITGQVGYLLDMTEPNLESGQLLMWHGGGGPLYLADHNGARWINHPMIGRGTEAGAVYGAIADLVFADGPVSILRVARNGSAFFQMTAQISNGESSGFSGCRGWLEGFDIGDESASLEDVLATVMSHGLEHHFVLVPGNISEVLSELSAWCDLQPLPRIPMRGGLRATDFT